MSDRADEVSTDEPERDAEDLAHRGVELGNGGQGLGGVGDESPLTGAAHRPAARTGEVDLPVRLATLYGTSAVGRQIAERWTTALAGANPSWPPPGLTAAFVNRKTTGMFDGIHGNIQKTLASAMNPMGDRLFAQLNDSIRRAGTLAPPVLPQLAPGLQSLADAVTKSLGRQWAETARAQVAELGRTFNRVLLPPNLRDSGDISVLDILDVAETEGIPLYLVPRASIARAILNGSDTESRRRVLNRRFDGILEDCEAVLDRCVAQRTRAVVPFARDAIRAARDGHHSAAQALAANVLDSTLRGTFDKKTREHLTSHKKTPTAHDLEVSIRQACVFIPIWRAHKTFQTYMGDPIPSAFSRHASAHAVSRRQFSKRNTAQAVMMLTSLIGFLNGL